MKEPSPEIASPAAPEVPDSRHDLRVLIAIRRIIRAADLFSRRLAGQHGITVPQLLCLSHVVSSGGMSIKDLAMEIFVSPSTVVGIIDRLEARNLVERHRSKPDMRLVKVVPTDEGKNLVERSPSALHEDLVAGLRQLPKGDQQHIAEAIEQLVSVMEIQHIDAAPILETKSDLDTPLS
ncbi:MAG: DNA-binding MarR family transcriptional regulator [Verrucomicrobiales bacterium]|jgi:DNA-binding MarR family transcriptional regulator